MRVPKDETKNNSEIVCFYSQEDSASVRVFSHPVEKTIGDCPIFLDVKDETLLTVCGHMFCKQCLVDYGEHFICPICRNQSSLY